MNYPDYFVLAVVAWTAVVAAMLLRYRREMGSAWREPALRRPVVIVESDDWGPGPDSDADWLARIADVLGRYKDQRGQHPVMTIGTVLALPDPGTGGASRVTLAADRFRAIRDRLVEGAESGMFALQLHGMEHFWLPAIQAAARRDAEVARWLRWFDSKEPPRTEALPPHLQSRWVDASRLPAVPLAADDIDAAASKEVATFSAVFNRPATVGVPPTFVWDERVERAWARGGIRYVVTPGRRYGGRDQAGRLVAEGAPIHTGQRSRTGVVYLVRDRYFEPALGHDAEHALAALAEKTRAAQPALLEMHRFNFTGDPLVAARTLTELDRFLAAAVQKYPGLRFLSTAELGEKVEAHDPDLVERGFAPRLAAVVIRLARISRLRKLAWLTGLAIPAWVLLCMAGSHRRAASAAVSGARLAT